MQWVGDLWASQTPLGRTIVSSIDLDKVTPCEYVDDPYFAKKQSQWATLCGAAAK